MERVEESEKVRESKKVGESMSVLEQESEREGEYVRVRRSERATPLVILRGKIMKGVKLAT